MKRALIFSAIFFLSMNLWSQRQGELQKIKAFKTGYLTQELDLSSEEAERFWPIYNEYEKKIFKLRVEKRKAERDRINELGGPEALTNEEAESILEDLFENESSVLNLKKKLYQELSTVLSPKKKLKLLKAEGDFNRRLLSEFKRRGPGRQGN